MLKLPNGKINEYQLKMINQWSSENINSFKSIYEKKYASNPEEAKECLNTIYEYRLSFSQCSDLNVSKLHEFGIKKFSSNGLKNRKIEDLIKNHHELIQEKQLKNNSTLSDQEIIQRVNNIKTLYKTYLNKEITKENITEDLKSKEDNLIAIAMSTLKSSNQMILRDSQIYALLLLLSKKKDKGKIIQVFSGEGKTIITFCLAIVLVLKGHKVDIICYSSEYAKRDSKKAKQILDKLKITVGNNTSKIINDCYKKDILYGSIENFQGGIMRDGYHLNGERQDRKFDIVIVDEIDSMLLDDYNQSTGLVSPKPFLEKYSIYLLILWGYYKNLHLNRFDVNKNEELKEKVKKYLLERIKNFISINNNKSEFFFPMSNSIKDFALIQSSRWVTSLIKSLAERKKVEYMIKGDEIIPIDFGDTGKIKKDKSFDSGLHQFLQMQNDLPVTPISTNTTSNSLSNYGFFQNFRRNDGNYIFGSTDAVGSVKSRQLLEDIYGIDFDYIPTNNSFLLKELTGNLSLNHELWVGNIIQIIKREINSGRVVLLLCETIEYCEEIYEKIRKNFPKFKLIKIIGEDNEKNLIPEKLSPKTVIISTDISGRGLSFKVGDEVLKNGGLHIIFSFITSNSRNEEKNYKNIGKAGDPGTFQYVLDFEETMNKYYVDYNIESHYEKYQNLLKEEKKGEEELKMINNYSIENIKNLREDRVTIRCNNALEKIINIKKEDLLFNIYCYMVDEKKELRDLENKENLNSIEEQWGIFLYSLDVKNKTLEQVKSECEKFKKNIFGEYNKGKIIKNPGYYNRYINEKLASIYNYVKCKNIMNQIKEDNFRTSRNVFVKNEEKIFEYDKFIQKCDLAIELDNYSFIPYYLKGMCKIMNGKEGIEDLKKSLFYIEEEIKRYFYYFGLLISLNINIDLLYHEISILNSIKINLIQKNINYLNNNNSNSLKNGINLYRILSKNLFYFKEDNEEEEEDGEKEEKNDNERQFPKYLKNYYDNLESNGLKYFFFFQDISSWKFNSIIISGIIMIALSISGISFLEKILTEEVFSTIGKMIGTSLSFNEYEEWIKKKHEKDFPLSTEKNLEEFLRKNNIKIKNTEFDLEKILKKFDHEFLNKFNRENELIFKNIFWKKIKKLNLEKLGDLIEKDEGKENFEENEKNLDKYKQHILNNIDENKRKIILANNYMRRDGRDWLTDDTRQGKNTEERIGNAQNELNGVADRVIIQELKELLNKEIESKKSQKENILEKVNKQKEFYLEKKKKYDINLESYNKRVDNYNSKHKQLNDKIDSYNKNLEKYNLDNNIMDKNKLDNDLKEIQNFQEEHKKEKEELDKISNEIEKEKENVNKENGITNKLIEEHNKCNSEINERIEIYNNLKDNLIIDFSKDELKIEIKKKEIDMPNFYIGIKQIEKDSNLAFKDELRIISKFEKEKENSTKIVKMRNEFELKLLKIIKEKHNYWENCFNKAFYALKYIYNSDDMKRIVNHQINKKNKNNEYYYLKDINDSKNINQAKENFDNKRVILGNYFNNNIWDNYCILPYNNSNIFLYKSPEGKNPPENLINAVKEITGGGYIEKVNKTIQKKEKLLTEVDAIENDKIIMEEIGKNKKEFVDKFEKYSNFYNETKEIKERIKQNTYPEEYIKGLYDEIKDRNNSIRISIIFFRHYFLEEENDNEINIDFLNKIYNILLNYNQIEAKEKEILKKEYEDILNVYNNIYVEIKKKEEEEEKEVEEIVKNKGKRNHSIKNIKNNKNENNNQNKSKESKNQVEYKENQDINGSNTNRENNQIFFRKEGNNNDDNFKSGNRKVSNYNDNKEDSKRGLIIKDANNTKESNKDENNIVGKDNNILIYNDYNIILQGPEISDEALKQLGDEIIYNQKKSEITENKEEGCCDKLCSCFKKNKT